MKFSTTTSLSATNRLNISAPAGCFYLWRDELLLASAGALAPDAAFAAREFLRSQAPFDEASGPSTFLADFGSEGDNPGPMLFYVPTGTSDPLISPLTDASCTTSRTTVYGRGSSKPSR